MSTAFVVRSGDGFLASGGEMVGGGSGPEIEAQRFMNRELAEAARDSLRDRGFDAEVVELDIVLRTVGCARRAAHGMTVALALLVCCAPVVGQLRFDGPLEGVAGTPLTIAVVGLPELDLTKPLGESLAWRDKFELVHSSPRTCDCEIDSDLALDFLAATWKLRVQLTGSEPGDVVLIARLGETLALHRVTLTGQVPIPPIPPTPGPDPPTPVPPTPTPGKRFVLIIEETADRTVERSVLYSNLQTHNAGKHRLLIADDDALSDGKMRPYLDLAGTERPYMIVTTMEGQLLWKGPAPKTIAEYDATLKGVGG